MRLIALVILIPFIFFIFVSTLNFSIPKPVTNSRGMVVTEQVAATEVGVDILRAGGNAIDAAVAVGYALAVVNPCCGNIGGGGFMTIHLANGKNVFLNFREKAPLNAKANMFLDKQGKLIANASTKGFLAVAVPGTVMGLDTALQKYGTMTRAQVMAPAIRLAEQGYIVTNTDQKTFQQYATDFSQQPNIAAIFLHDGKIYQAGERLVQIDLANTLKLIAAKGAKVFYQGEIADKIVAASKAHGGILTQKDLASYQVKELTPVYCNYRGYTIVSSPLPSSGGTTLCEMLNILENFSLAGYCTRNNPRPIIEAMRYAFYDRNSKLNDPNFGMSSTQQLLQKDYAKHLSEKIKASNFAPVAQGLPLAGELTDTTHYSIIDNKGNAVATTYTLNGFFGAKVIAGNTGFFLNDEMDDFTTQVGTPNMFGLVQSAGNSIEPGKQPLSSMTPTIILKNNKVVMLLGSPGGPRIITSVLLAILNVIDCHMNIKQAIDAPRFHYQGIPDLVDAEPLVFSFLTRSKLQLFGYYLNPQARWSAVEMIQVDPDNNLFYGANDNRRPDGAALGW